MTGAVADTNAALWYFIEPRRLSPAADAALTAAANGTRIYISAMTLVEVIYLVTKPSFAYPHALSILTTLAADPSEPLEILPITIDIALAVQQVPRKEVPELPDRVIAATAIVHNLPLVTADTRIRGSAGLNALVPVIW